ncbi:MBL fold metallo-hydrolase [Salinarchaeum sp. Harcht-Bsk1]|uniref:MBL fold metallo-hydrolase n=1 Tax=Salinarchaeum sp. Harcht-Bsk1 TaxID=1333523 RepID=UPI0009DC3678|nr:MBL fold metallo-hydrolase [Salinarchaeum sp. Harcht-Bsk1]
MHAIRLDNAVFEGDNVVYLLDPREGPTTLIDAGVPTEPVREDLRAGLADAGVAIADLDRILLTHWHWDHSGLAGELQADSGADVFVHEDDAPLVDGSGRTDYQDLQRRLFERWGIPEAPLAELTGFLEGHDSLAGEPADVTTFTHGERFPLGAGSAPTDDGDADEDVLRAIHLPGHAAGLTAYAFERRAEAFVGDVILPKYTPNVGGADPRVERPLATYRSSLRWLAATDLDRAFPGHRDPIDDPATRAEEILTHHEERTERTRDAVDALGPATPWEIAAELFGGLSNIHIMHGPGEAWAHLEALVEDGEVERSDDDAVTRYRLARQ